MKVKVGQCVGQQGRIPKIKLTCLGVSLEINLTHYNKLRLLHAHAAGDVEHNETSFCQHAMALLLRYSSLQGTHYRGGGFQVCATCAYLEKPSPVFFTLHVCLFSAGMASAHELCSASKLKRLSWMKVAMHAGTVS